MATIQDKLSILAKTTEAFDDSSDSRLSDEKKNVTLVDFKMVTFSLSGKDYAIDIMKVKEIAKAGHFTYVPNTLPFVRGVYNLRGDIIPIIDLRLFFNIDVSESDDEALENMLIVTVGEQTFGVVVDDIDKVVGIQKSSIQPPHPLFGDINIKYIYGVVEAEKRLYILLDIDRIFGVHSIEEAREMAASAKRNISAEEKEEEIPARSEEKTAEEKVAAVVASEPKSKEDIAAENMHFVSESLKNLRKFSVNSITEDWFKNRFKEWSEARGENIQLLNEADADSFLAPFYSRCNGTWWTEDYAQSVYKILPDNSARNIVVWNPGCGKGFESYSLACILKKRYPNASIKIYAHDVDLLSVSNAPLMNLTDEASRDWYQPYTTKTASGDYTFSKEIKDSVMFEYHDCVNTNSLPPIDIIFVRDMISFIPEKSQEVLLSEFAEKMKGNGIIVSGDNEVLSVPGFTRKTSGNVAFYSK